MRAAIVSLVLTAALPAQPLNAQTAHAPSNSDSTTSATPETGRVAEEAAPGQPMLRVDFPETEAIPGQFLTLRVTVLVPSFMPDPPVWPSFEAPNLLVRVPEGGTSPVSKRIDGETWSGVSRRYLISPMVLGTFEIAPQEVVITWADTAADDPARVVVLTEAFSFSGVLPDGVEDLDPFIAASELTLTQEIEGDPGAMVPGASVTRAITVKVAGVSPMFLPDLLLPFEVSGVAAYPDKPTLIETDNRGALGGTRRESVSYVAESGGAGTLPEIELPWFDIDTGTIEMARAEAVDISVDGPPAALADLEVSRRTAFLAAAGVVLAVLLAVGLRVVLRVLRRRTAKRREARLASEDHAWRSLMLAVAQHDHAALYPALDTWAERVNGVDPRLVSEVQAALVTLWRGRYGADSGSKAHPNKAWRNLGDTLRSARKPPPSKALHNTLLPLNPGASA